MLLYQGEEEKLDLKQLIFRKIQQKQKIHKIQQQQENQLTPGKLIKKLI